MVERNTFANGPVVGSYKTLEPAGVRVEMWGTPNLDNK
jgi:hypothetical protein